MSSSTSVTYSSTRGGQTNLDFRTVVMQGLAHDRGLFVPDRLPSVDRKELEEWRKLSFPELAIAVISKFVGPDQVPTEKLRDIVTRSCAAFRHRDVTPIKHVGGHAILVCIFMLQLKTFVEDGLLTYGFWLLTCKCLYFFNFILFF
jgi:threonine synthase